MIRPIDLKRDEIERALPLVQLSWPATGMADWLRFVDRIVPTDVGPEAGILALEDSDGYLNGLMVYRVEMDLRGSRCLHIHLCTAIDLPNSIEPARSLLQAATERMQHLHCRQLSIRLSDDQKALRQRLVHLGMQSNPLFLQRTSDLH